MTNRKAKSHKNIKKSIDFLSNDKFQNSWNFSNQTSIPENLPGINNTQTKKTNEKPITNEQVDELIERINRKFIPDNAGKNISDKEEYLNTLQKLFIAFSEEKTNPVITIKNYIILAILLFIPSKKLASLLVNK